MHCDMLFKAGMPAIITVGDPGTQGAVVFGMQVIGVSTPIAAAVAEATIGLARDVHMPKDMVFTIGRSSMFTADSPPTMVRNGPALRRLLCTVKQMPFAGSMRWDGNERPTWT
jgi:hypothetical protein